MTLVNNPTHHNESEFSHLIVFTLSIYFNRKREFKSIPGVIMMPKQPIQIHRSATVNKSYQIDRVQRLTTNIQLFQALIQSRTHLQNLLDLS